AVPTRVSSFRLLELTCQNGVFVGSDCNNNVLRDETGVKRGDTVGLSGMCLKHCRGAQDLYRNFMEPLHKPYRIFITFPPGCFIFCGTKRGTKSAALERSLQRCAAGPGSAAWPRRHGGGR